MPQDGIIAYFGYGSLVNRETLRTAFVDTRRARLKGWRRHWQSRGIDLAPASADSVALLSVHPCPNCDLHGIVVFDRLAHLEEVDRREALYGRHRIPTGGIEFETQDAWAAAPEEIFVYVADQPADPGEDSKLLQSYLDAVMAGYLREFGEPGLRHFIETTIGFDREMICDRGQPLYPRSVEIDRGVARLFDRLLAEAGVRCL
jgi:hypothetical protein